MAAKAKGAITRTNLHKTELHLFAIQKASLVSSVVAREPSLAIARSSSSSS